MAGKTYIEGMLSAWGMWSVANDGKARGYATESAMFREDVSGGAYGARIPRGIGNREILLIDAEVALLPDVQRMAVCLFYKRGGSVRSLADRAGVRRDTLEGWLAKAHKTIQTNVSRGMAEARGAREKGTLSGDVDERY